MQHYEYQGDGVLKRPVLVTIDEVKLKEEQLSSFFENGNNIITRYLDSEAKKRGYDSITSARSYAGFTNNFQVESQKFVKLSSVCWNIGFSLLNDIKNGTRTTLTEEELIALLPDFDSITL